MAKKKIELYLYAKNEKEFEEVLNKNRDRLICAEIYCGFSGSCTALDRLFTTIKLDWSNGQIVLLKVLADEINSLNRFHGGSEPIYMFIINHRVTQLFRGVDNIRFAEVARREINYFNIERQGAIIERDTYAVDQITPGEVDYYKTISKEKRDEMAKTISRRQLRQAVRKRHRAELMVPYLKELNFVIYWPHATHAHPELYERWNLNNIIMVAREEVQLTAETAEDVLYKGDVQLNEASLQAMLAAPSLAICFRLLDSDQCFVSLVRKILYEEEMPVDESKPLSEQPYNKTAFDIYKSYSPSREEIWQKRREEKMRVKQENKEKRARRLSEMQRLARQAIEEAIENNKKKKELRKLDLLKAGKLEELANLDQEADEEISIEIPEELSEEEEEQSEEEDPDEYFPPPGLLIPGLYAPPNELAKTNGLAILFPKLVAEKVIPQPEFLPPHVLLLLPVSKRYKALEVLVNHVSLILHMGIFKANTPYKAQHIAYTVKQYDTMKFEENNMDDVKIAFMVSLKSELALLELMDLSPVHVSRDPCAGEEECAAMFPVGYGDGYTQFEDFNIK